MRNITTLFMLWLCAGLLAQSRLQQLYILGGELSNSAATSVADIDEVVPRMARLGLNTLLVPVCWDLTEPVEGHFDFTLVDRVIDCARQSGLRIVPLWFGAWKNSMSCYAPQWLKEDTRRFPRAMTRQGKPLEIASAFSDEVLSADCRAFTRLMEHIAEKDRSHATVVMVQIENEIGMLEDARDHSPLANRAYAQQVPQQLLKALRLNRKGSWAQVFGTSLEADEKFMAWHFASYVEHLAQAARRTLGVPLYVNAAMNSRGRLPGQYPSAGPLAHLAAIWKTAAPSIDLLAPDIYDTGFKAWAAQYDMPDNRLFIPESRCSQNSGVRALYVFGEHRALGFSPFAIDQAPTEQTAHITRAYGLLRQLQNLRLRDRAAEAAPWRESGACWGLLFDQQDCQRVINDGDLTLTCSHFFTLPWDPRATDGSTWPEGGAVVIRLQKDQYIIAGSGIVIDFKTQTEKAQEQQNSLGEDGFAMAGNLQKPPISSNKTTTFKGKRCGIVSVDQVSIDNQGQLHFIRRDNGDQDHQGRHARISVGEYEILHVKLYRY